MLRHHSFAKSLVQEKEKDLKEEGRLQLPHFAIRLKTHMSGLIRKSKCIQNRKNRWNLRENGIDH